MSPLFLWFLTPSSPMSLNVLNLVTPFKKDIIISQIPPPPLFWKVVMALSSKDQIIHSSLLRAFGLNATSPCDSYLPLLNLWKICIDLSKSRQKLDVILENKVVQKLKFSKNANNRKCAPKIIFFNEFFLRKIWIFFDVENWLWKSEFCHFWQLLFNWVQDLKTF